MIALLDTLVLGGFQQDFGFAQAERGKQPAQVFERAFGVLIDF
jgi:hypothetical protein